MKKGNIIDLRAYRKRAEASRTSTKPTVSKELQYVIKRLIQRMRKGGPARRTKVN